MVSSLHTKLHGAPDRHPVEDWELFEEEHQQLPHTSDRHLQALP